MQMDSEGFTDALERLDLSQERFARLIGYDERTIKRYALGEAEVPRIIELLLNWALYAPATFAELVKARELLDDEL